MNTQPMPHLLILLPGVMGSALQKDGRDVWALSGQALGAYVGTLGRSVDTLRVEGDDRNLADLGDGVRATHLIEDIHAVPGLMEHAGYSVIVRQLQEAFDLEAGSIHAPHDSANFYSFPYDWRRDNRATALKVKTFIDQQLRRWRAYSGADQAQVVLIGHSLGGLIARYYVEALEGWRDCLALITVGSPHRGAVAALGTLSNGVHRCLGRLNDVVRSFESAYQILPTYPAVMADSDLKRVIEFDALPNIDLPRARHAREDFLQAIVDAAGRNATDPRYRQRTIPWVGTGQGAPQLAELRAGQLVIRKTPPAGLPEQLAGGDGTVARVSATPVDLDGQRLERFATERHGWLTNNPMTLAPLLDTLRQIVSGGAAQIHGDLGRSLTGISLSLEPMYTRDEPVTIEVKLVATDAPEQALDVSLEIVPHGQASERVTRVARITAAEARSVAIEDLAPGLYDLTASVLEAGHLPPTHGIFEVIDPAQVG